MKRFVYNIQYNQKDKVLDKVFVDAPTKTKALNKLKVQFPGVFRKLYCYEYEL